MLKPLASLRITVTLLLLSMVLVFAGTTAQHEMSIQDVQRLFFHSFWAKVSLRYFDPHYIFPVGKAARAYWPGWFPLPGGYTLILAMGVNLLAAHVSRFKLRWNRVGIILIHAGLVLLLAGELMTSLFAVESQMRINVGQSTRYADDIRTYELAVIDPSPADHDDVTVIPARVLTSAAGAGTVIHDPKLPFDVKVERWYPNSEVVGPQQSDATADHLATAGAYASVGIRPTPRVTGTDAEKIDVPSAFVTLSRNGQSLGTYLVSLYFSGMMEGPEFNQPQLVGLEGRNYQIALRFRRDYKPYAVTLKKFTHDTFLGTNEAKDFASDIRLSDPSRHVDRDVHIWMNHPLRYNGETFYQQSFANNDQTSILQVVKNPVWRWPYIACAVGALGLVLHFGMTLANFLRKTMAAAPIGTDPFAPARSIARPPARGKKGGALPANVTDAYSISPVSAGPLAIAVPIVIVCFALLFVVSRVFSPWAAAQYDYQAFGRLPISFEGRVQPLHSLAVNSLKVISGRDNLKDKDGASLKDENGKPVSQDQWLLETMTRKGSWDQYYIFRIDLDSLKDVFKLPADQKLFSWRDLFPDGGNGQEKLLEQAKLAVQVPDNQRDIFQNQALELWKKRNMILRLMQVGPLATQYSFYANPDRSRDMMRRLGQAISANDPDFLNKLQGSAANMQEADRLFRTELAALPREKLSAEQRQALEDYIGEEDRQAAIESIPPNDLLYLAAPLSPSEKWQTLAAPRDGGASEGAKSFCGIIADFQAEKPGDFNADLAAYQARLDQAMPREMNRVAFETWFDQFDPFNLCCYLYVAVFVLCAFSWLALNKAFWRSAFALLLAAWLLHTFGLASRIYMSGRPPVTNLYSSAVYIAWVCVAVAMGVELIFRRGFGLVVASMAGFGSLLVAAGLASTDGDTMKQLQAVLDTNFWLATHVVCVTQGYAATFLAGVLAVVFILLNVFTPVLRDKEVSRTFSRAIYGIICFAMLFSFVGTILGGIWADQSWGRFWGWDPKENGAVLIVIWNALILHARWAGLVRERGVAVLAIFGNIVTSWSWFGTNMMGIGLHSYGFMGSAAFYLFLWMAANAVFILIGLLPKKWWVGNLLQQTENLPPLAALHGA